MKTPERVRFDHRIKMHIARKEAVTTKAPLRPIRDNERAVAAVVRGAAERSRPVAVLVLGQVGSGKTTFLEFTKKSARERCFKPTLVAHTLTGFM